jgi:hypothetical protein
MRIQLGRWGFGFLRNRKSGWRILKVGLARIDWKRFG